MEKIAAVFARVSDPKQEEPSLERQVATIKPWLEEQGWIVPTDKVISVVWTSTRILSCPAMQRLLAWIRNGEIGAVGMTHLDRLSGRPGHMGIIFDTIKEAGCALLAKDTPLPPGLMGEIMALVLAIAKAVSVDKADTGAKEGLEDRAKRKKLPTSHHKVFGYTWEGDRRLVPNEDWETIKLILDMALGGATQYAIQQELKRRGVLSPRGNPVWGRSTILFILRNPIYAGRYYALHREAVEPARRKVEKEGKTSSRDIPLDKAVYLPEIEIENPPITWEQYLQIQDQLQKNKELARRNAKNDYLLRGMVFCETHRGKKGEPKHYFGHPNGKSYDYACPVGGCAHPNLNGREMEQAAKDFTTGLLNLEPDQFYQLIADKKSKRNLEQSLERELRALEAEYSRNISADTEIERRDVLGQLHPEVYRRIKEQHQAQRVWIEERKEAIAGQLAQLSREAEALESLQQIRHGFRDRLSELSNNEWRQLFTTLNLEIHVRDSNNLETLGNRWWERRNFMAADKTDLEISFGLPIKAEPVVDIVLNRARVAGLSIYLTRKKLAVMV